jgi:hypothetical protein
VAKEKKKKAVRVELTLYGVCLSYPDLHQPKPYKGNIYYKTDCLFDPDYGQLKELRSAITKVRTEAFGTDKEEWPKGAKKKFVREGAERANQEAYQGKMYISASTKQRVPVVDLKGKEFSAASVKGGMWANVALCISTWRDPDGEEGMSIYLQGVQIDTSREGLNFGGGRSVKDMFKSSDPESEEVDDDDVTEVAAKGTEDDDEDAPRAAKSNKERNFDEDYV